MLFREICMASMVVGLAVSANAQGRRGAPKKPEMERFAADGTVFDELFKAVQLWAVMGPEGEGEFHVVLIAGRDYFVGLDEGWNKWFL